MSEIFSLLALAQSGDEQACEQVLTENAGLIWSVVRRYYGCGVDPEDLYQLGCLGFLKAVRGFDLDYGTKFSTYAVPKIAGEIRRFLRDDGSIKVSRTLRERAQHILSARRRLILELGHEPTISEIAAETGLEAAEIAQAELSCQTPESLQAEREDGLTLEGMLGTDAPEDRLIEQIALREQIETLPEREKKVILLRFFKSLTQEQTARVLQVSQVQVSRLEKRAINRLRESLKELPG